MSDRTREMATVRENSRILDGYYKMTLHAPVIAQRCRPGQFVFIRVGSGTAPLLRRPISICEADSVGGTLTLLYRVVGTGTDLLSAATRPMTCAERRCGPTGQYTPPMRAKAA